MRSSLVVLLLAGGACADDVPSTTRGDSDTDPGTSTTDSPTTGVTTVDPDTTAGGSVGMESGDTTTEGVTTAPETDSATTNETSTGGPVCGNGLVEPGEDCDSEDLGGEDCASQGFDGGVLLCADDCTFDLTQCTSGECGDGVVDAGEACDGVDLGGASCQTEGFDGGTLACAVDCTLDTSGCANVACGDGVVDAGEACDGAALNGQDCVSQGFGGGVLGCTADCLGYDTAGCTNEACVHDICVTGAALTAGCDPCVDQICAVDAFCCNNSWDGQCVGEVDSICGIVCPPPPPVCGDGVIDAGETCDGAALNGETCVTQGFGGGALACAADCLSYDTAGCNAGGGDCCAAHAGTGCDDAACEASVCGADPFCCNSSWDGQCANEAIADPACGGVGGSCPAAAVCGDGAVGAGEVCDGASLNGQTCVSQGFAGGGVLACAAGCATFDTTGCIAAGGGDCCAAHATPGCQNAVCQAAICGADAFCCNNQWDGQCANAADVNPACVGAGGTCPVPAVCGDGVITAPETCDGANLNGQTCVTQGFAGGVLACGAGCNAFNTAGCMGVGGFPCQDEDIGSAIGANVSSGTTVGQDNDLNPSCGAGDALDRVIRFQAPAAGQYTFSTNGATYDTVMSLFSDCTTQLACDDDSGAGTQSLLVRNMAAGEVVLILVDGYNGATGNWILNITSP